MDVLLITVVYRTGGVSCFPFDLLQIGQGLHVFYAIGFIAPAVRYFGAGVKLTPVGFHDRCEIIDKGFKFHFNLLLHSGQMFDPVV